MKEDRRSEASFAEQGGETAEKRTSVPLNEILRAVEKRTDLTEEEREALKTLCPKILETAKQLAETPLPSDKKEQREDTDDFKKETGENGRKMIEAINDLLKRGDLPEGEKVFDAQYPELAKLKIDIKKFLSVSLRYLSEAGLAVEKDKADMNDVYKLYVLYGVVNANVGGELGKEIKEKLKPLFDERFRLINLAVEENEGAKLEWRHLRTGELIDEKKDTCDSSTFVEGIGLARIAYMKLPGVVQKFHLGEGEFEEVARSFTSVIVGTG